MKAAVAQEHGILVIGANDFITDEKRLCQVIYVTEDYYYLEDCAVSAEDVSPHERVMKCLLKAAQWRKVHPLS